MRAIALGDLLDGVQCVQDRLAVGVETPILLFRSGIAPRDREDLDALAQKVLDHAAPWRDVHDVELVDHRRHHQQRRREDLVGLRGVLDQLEFLASEDHRTCGGGDVLAQRERVGLHHRRHPRRRHHVLDEVAQPPNRAESTGVDERLPSQRVQHRVVGRCEPFGEEIQHESNPLGVTPVEVRVRKQLIHSVVRRQIGLHRAVEQRIAPPCRICESLVALRRGQLRTAFGNGDQFPTERRCARRHRAGLLGEVEREAAPRHVRQHPVRHAHRRTRQQQIKRCRQLVGVLLWWSLPCVMPPRTVVVSLRDAGACPSGRWEGCRRTRSGAGTCMRRHAL